MKTRSVFWPLVMIAIGVLWLLTGLRVIPASNLWALMHFLPYILMVLGLGLILRSYWPYSGMLASVLVVSGAVLAVLFAPQLGWASVPSWGLGWDSDFGGAVTGSGVVKTDTRQVKDFTAVSIKYPADVVIQQGTTDSVTLEADENLLPQLRTEIKSGVLYIENSEPDWKKRVNPSSTVRVKIVSQDLRAVEFSSAGTMRIENIKGENLDIAINGAGEVILKNLEVDKLSCRLSGAGSIAADGTTNEISLRISGMGNFNGGELHAQIAFVNISGAGQAILWLDQQLTAEISGAGSVDYYGSPRVDKQISGAGGVNQLGNK
jgi:hypothetical protein